MTRRSIPRFDAAGKAASIVDNICGMHADEYGNPHSVSVRMRSEDVAFHAAQLLREARPFARDELGALPNVRIVAEGRNLTITADRHEMLEDFLTRAGDAFRAHENAARINDMIPLDKAQETAISSAAEDCCIVR